MRSHKEMRAQYHEYEQVSSKPEQLNAVKKLTKRYKSTADSLQKRKTEIRKHAQKRCKPV